MRNALYPVWPLVPKDPLYGFGGAAARPSDVARRVIAYHTVRREVERECVAVDTTLMADAYWNVVRAGGSADRFVKPPFKPRAVS